MIDNDNYFERIVVLEKFKEFVIKEIMNGFFISWDISQNLVVLTLSRPLLSYAKRLSNHCCRSVIDNVNS